MRVFCLSGGLGDLYQRQPHDAHHRDWERRHGGGHGDQVSVARLQSRTPNAAARSLASP